MFWRKPLVDEPVSEWVIECFEWYESLFPTPQNVILPTKEFFSAGRGKDHQTAEAVTHDICKHLNFNQKITLEPLEQLSAEYRHSYQALSETAGTFQQGPSGAIIHYDAEMMQSPIRFIYTMAHEIMHGQLSEVAHEGPGGIEAHELVTDLCCIVAGFGVFQLQAAEDAGWAGYLSQTTRAYALALYLQRKGLVADACYPSLSPRPQKLLKRAVKYIEQS